MDITYSNPYYYVSCLWMCADNGDYDDIWDVIFAEEGITPEEEIAYDPELDDEEEWNS